MIHKDTVITGVEMTHAEPDSIIGEVLIVEDVMKIEIALMSVQLDLEATTTEGNQLWMVIVIIG